MVGMLARNWWVVALRGVAAVIFGVLALVWPGVTLQVLVLLFGAYAVVDGIFAAVTAVATREHHEHWWVMLLEGLAGIIVGLLTFFWPGVTALVLLYFIAAWALVTGALEIVAAIELRRFISGEWMLILGGMASIVFGVFIAAFPAAGALSVILLIGVYAIVFGILLLVLAFRLRGLQGEAEAMHAHGR